MFNKHAQKTDGLMIKFNWNKIDIYNENNIYKKIDWKRCAKHLTSFHRKTIKNRLQIMKIKWMDINGIKFLLA